MIGRAVPVSISVTEQGELPKDVQVRLEQDKIYFLEHRGKQVFNRSFVPGEAYPYACPAKDTIVRVDRSGRRTFIALEKAVLVINPQIVDASKKAKKSRSQPAPSVRRLQKERVAKRKANQTSLSEVTDEHHRFHTGIDDTQLVAQIAQEFESATNGDFSGIPL